MNFFTDLVHVKYGTDESRVRSDITVFKEWCATVLSSDRATTPSVAASRISNA